MRVFTDFGDANISEDVLDDGYDGLKIRIEFNVATLTAIICRIVGD